MRYDEPKKSPEFLDETKPERNERSLFERLLGRESEEEKLRKKLNEELKEAARRRAEQFEEERRVAEEREVGETRKLKKRWRARLVEKSQKILEEAEGHEEGRLNGFQVAKIMVAERIVRLHEMLHDDNLDLRRSEEKALKIHIDFMGLLSEKLDRPELEVPEEVEQLYQTIAESVEEVTGETPPQENPNENPLSPEEAVPMSEADSAYGLFAASIVRAIRRVLRPEASMNSTGGRHSEDETIPRTTNTAESPRQEFRHTPSSTSIPEAVIVTERLLTIVKKSALPSEKIREEITHAGTARRLAEIVEKAEAINMQSAPQAKRPAAHTDATEAPKTTLSNTIRESSTYHNESSPRITEKLRPSIKHVNRPTTSQGFDLGPNKKIKHLAEAELLKLAQMVEIGQGRLLSDVYKRGEIDREGLIKVLESFKKGQDYRSELIYRREKWRRHRESSPEYIAPMTSVPIVPATQPRQSPRQSKVAETMRNIGRVSTKVPEKAKAETKHVARAIRDRVKRQNHITTLFATLFLVVVILLVVIELNSR